MLCTPGHCELAVEATLRVGLAEEFRRPEAFDMLTLSGEIELSSESPATLDGSSVIGLKTGELGPEAPVPRKQLLSPVCGGKEPEPEVAAKLA